MQLNPYLFFNGQCQAAFKFYEQCLGGKVESMLPYEGSPMAEQVPSEWSNQIMHAEFKVGDFILMGSDDMPGKYKEPKGWSVMLSLDDPSEAERIFHALSENGTVKMPIQETFWAACFGALVDQFGTPWMINCDKAS